MHYGTSSALIIISIIILALALITAIVSYRSLTPAIPSNNSSGDIDGIKGVLVFFIIVDSVMLLFAFYGLAKLRTSNMGGWIGFILGLIVIVFVMIFGISAINKVDSVAFPWALRGLVFNTVMITLVFFLLILSVFTKPKLCTGNVVKKIFQGMKNKIGECGVPKEECVPACPPPMPKVPCPQPVQPVAQCAPQYMNTNGQVSQYIVNPYLPQQG